MTDDKDRQLLITLLEKCCCQELVSIPRHKLSPSGTYFTPEPGSHQDYLKYAYLLLLIVNPVQGLCDAMAICMAFSGSPQCAC